jgi:DNA-directed RNA polymerase specialized sigma24 family protein
VPAGPTTNDGQEEIDERLRALIQARRLSWYALARATLRDPQLAEDCLQDALLLAWRHRAEVRDLEALDSWVRQILVRRCNAARLGLAPPNLDPTPATAVEDAAV